MGSLIPWSRKHDPLEHTALLFFFFWLGRGYFWGGGGWVGTGLCPCESRTRALHPTFLKRQSVNHVCWPLGAHMALL